MLYTLKPALVEQMANTPGSYLEFGYGFVDLGSLSLLRIRNMGVGEKVALVGYALLLKSDGSVFEREALVADPTKTLYVQCQRICQWGNDTERQIFARGLQIQRFHKVQSLLPPNTSLLGLPNLTWRITINAPESKHD